MSSRSDSDFLFDEPVVKVRAVSASRAAVLRKMGIRSVRDLIENYPRRYIDLSNVETVSRAPIGQFVTVIGQVDEVKEKKTRKNIHILEVSVFDGTGILIATWFRQPWMASRFEKGMRVAFSGKVAFDYGFKRMNSPLVAFLDASGGNGRSMPGMLAVHPTVEGLSATWMRRLIANAIEQASDIDDPLPAELRDRYSLMSKKAALKQIHFPSDGRSMSLARKRLAYEEALLLQLEMMLVRRNETRNGTAVAHVEGRAVKALNEALPFELTQEQGKAASEIMEDMKAPHPMNRMLLGDVGTGKTVVAAFALALCADSGCQAAMMAPTEVLARQYESKLGPLFDSIGVTWATLTGSTPRDEKAAILERAADGSLQVLFGTHALIEPNVGFSRLSLVVIDEQHRFGVAQRSALRMKGSAPDLLMMTATPIPRTLALAVYGDLDTSYIRERPGNAVPTSTRLVSRDSRGKAYAKIKEALEQGRQAYVICPLVGVSREKRIAGDEDGTLAASLAGGEDISDPKAAESEAARLQREVFPGYKVGLLTGRMSAAEKQEAMDAFNAKDIDVLVATTVVEVGIDVPNATVMMIEDAERFGLSQLHQLRGRVGRGKHPGHVFLVADPGKDDSQTKERLEAFINTDDGFALAEEDLKTRREGDVLGRRQHGAQTLKLVNVIDDAALIECANKDAKGLLEEDPGLSDERHASLKCEVERLLAMSEETFGIGA